MINLRKLHVGLVSSVAVLASFAPELAIAQEARDGTVEDIIVTAQKREQSLQDVPVAVTAFSDKYLKDFGVRNWDDLKVPGAHIGKGARNESLFVRGVGSGTNFGFEQSVPVYVDGIYFGRARAENIGFLDLQRIEVLKGPQPTFFGQNAIAGALNITSARPTAEFEGYLDGTYEFNAREKAIAGAISGPLSDSVRVRAAVNYRDIDGWVTNVARGNAREPQTKDFAARLGAEFDLSDSFKAFVKYEHAYSEQKGRNRQLVSCGVTNTNAALLASRINPALEDCTFNKTLASSLTQAPHPHIPIEGNFGYISRLNYDGGQINLDWDIGGATLSSNTAYYKVNFRIPQNDTDGTSNEIGAIATTDRNKQFSQELRILSTIGGRVEWLAGLYFDHADLTTSGDGDLYVAFPVPVSPALFQDASQTSKSWSAFGELAFKVADPFTIKFGARYSEVRKSTVISLDSQRLAGGVLINQPFRPGPGNVGPVLFPAFNFVGSRKDTKFQPAVTLEWRPATGTMLYASWKQGFKAGGFDQDSLVIPPTGTLTFNPETVNAYEAGVKARIMDGKATVNVAVFRSDYKDLQVSIFTGTIGFFTTNAASSRSQGVEVDTTVAVSNHVTLNASINYLDSKYRSFPGGACDAARALAIPAGCTQDFSGNPTQFAPKWSGNIGANFKAPLGTSLFGSDLRVVGQTDLFFTSRYKTSNGADPITQQAGFAKIDARLGFGADNGGWELAVVGRNLTNRKTTHFAENAVLGPLAVGVAYQKFLDRTRQVAIQAKMKF